MTKQTYQIVLLLLLLVGNYGLAQVKPTPTKTEIVMTTDELKYLLEQIARAEIQSIRDKKLDSLLKGTESTTQEGIIRQEVLHKYITTQYISTATPTVVMYPPNAKQGVQTQTVYSPTSVIVQNIPAQNTTALQQQLADLSASIQQLRQQQQALMAALAVGTGAVLAKNSQKEVPNAGVNTTTVSSIATGVRTAVVAQPTTTPTVISPERRMELELILANRKYKTSFIYFANNSATPQPQNIEGIDEAVALLKAHPELSVLLEGYASNVGGADYNNYLSMQRSINVSKLLQAKGIEAERILTAFKGIDKNANASTARRVEILVIIK